MTGARGLRSAGSESEGLADQYRGSKCADIFWGVGVVNVFAQKKPPISSLPFVPDPPSDFTGRDEELKELQAKFEAGTTIIGLRGIGGVGKTALALKLVESLKTAIQTARSWWT